MYFYDIPNHGFVFSNDENTDEIAQRQQDAQFIQLTDEYYQKCLSADHNGYALYVANGELTISATSRDDYYQDYDAKTGKWFYTDAQLRNKQISEKTQQISQYETRLNELSSTTMLLQTKIRRKKATDEDKQRLEALENESFTLDEQIQQLTDELTNLQEQK